MRTDEQENSIGDERAAALAADAHSQRHKIDWPLATEAAAEHACGGPPANFSTGYQRLG